MLGSALRPEEVHLRPEGENEVVVGDGRETLEPDLLGFEVYRCDRRLVDRRVVLILDEIAERYLPFSLVIPVVPGPAQARLAPLLPFTAAMAPVAGRAAAYVCRDFSCQQPVTSRGELRRSLEQL